MKTTDPINQYLTGVVGQYMRLVNESSEDSNARGVQVHVHGKLEAPDDDGAFYVRIGEDPRGHGCNGVSFHPCNVIEAYKQPSGIIFVILRG